MNEPAPPPPPSTPPPPTSAGSGGGGATSDNRGIMIVLSYLWLLALIPLLVEKEDQEVQWHAKHGIVLMVAEIVLWIVLTVLSIALAAVGIGCLLAIFQMIMTLVIIVIHIICIVKGVGGERFLIPGVSQYADRF